MDAKQHRSLLVRVVPFGSRDAVNTDASLDTTRTVQCSPAMSRPSLLTLLSPYKHAHVRGTRERGVTSGTISSQVDTHK